MGPHQHNKFLTEDEEMTPYVIDYGRPILEQLIENISKRQAKKVFRNVFVATDILNSGETLFMPLNNGLNLQAVQAIFKNNTVEQQNENGDNIYTTVHKLAVSEDQLIGQTNIAFSEHQDEQIQFMIKDESKTFLMSCCRQQILNKKHLNEYFPVLRRKLKVLKPVNEQLINYFNVVLPQKLQDEQDQKLFERFMSKETSQREKIRILNQLGDKYDVLRAKYEMKLPETYYVTEEFMNSVNLTFKENVVEELPVIQKELFSIRYYKCFQNIYYYFQLSYNVLQYLKILYPLEERRAKIDSSSSSGMDSGVIEHISENILLSLFEPLHEAFKAIMNIDMENTNHQFRVVVRNNQFHVVQLIKMLLQIHSVQNLENRINQLYNHDIYDFLKDIDQSLKQEIDNKLNIFTVIIKKILELLNVSYEDCQVLLTRSKQHQESFNQELDTVLSHSLIVKLTMDQNVQIQAYLGMLMEIKRYVLWLQDAYKKFDRELIELTNFNQSNIGDFYSEYVNNKNTDIMTKKSKELFYKYNKIIGDSMNQYIGSKYKQLARLKDEYEQLLLHRKQIQQQIDNVTQKIQRDNIQVILDENDRQQIEQSRDSHSLSVSQKLSTRMEI